MAIRERIRRAMHKSESSSNVSFQYNSQYSSTNNSTTNINTTVLAVSESWDNPPSSLRKAKSTKLFRWRSHDPDANSDSAAAAIKKKAEQKAIKAAKKSSSKSTHPRDKPLTATNLRHQEMLSGFSMTFGSSPSRLSQLVPYDEGFEGVSPCCTRNPSFDGGAVDPVSSHDSSRMSLPEMSDAVPPPKVSTI